MRSNIYDLYSEALTEETSLFPQTSVDFWAEYISNYDVYDRYFMDKFRNFYYWLVFDDDTETSDILTDFKACVNAFLKINAKKYSELYRVHTLSEDAYSITDNYSMTEERQATYTEGARTDSESVTQGAQTNTGTTSLGAQTNTNENTISAFNSSSYQDDNENTQTIGAQENSSSTSIGARSDSMSSTKGEQENSDSYTLTRNGNIGVATASQIIGGHIDLWDKFSFYDKVFDDIAKNYLLVNEYGGTL